MSVLLACGTDLIPQTKKSALIRVISVIRDSDKKEIQPNKTIYK